MVVSTKSLLPLRRGREGGINEEEDDREEDAERSRYFSLIFALSLFHLLLYCFSHLFKARKQIKTKEPPGWRGESRRERGTDTDHHLQEQLRIRKTARTEEVIANVTTPRKCVCVCVFLWQLKSKPETSWAVCSLLLVSLR